VKFLEETGIDLHAIQRCIEEQIYTLPGTESHDEVLSVALTGSRAIGTWAETSDVDLDVLCPQEVFDSVLAASAAAGLISSDTGFLRHIPAEPRYFGDRNAHVSLTSLDEVSRQVRDYEDVPLWIWTNARIIADPGDQLRRIAKSFQGYPRHVLIRKIKYRWMLSGYWAIEVYPHGHRRDDQLLPAVTALVNSMNDLTRFFFLIDGTPFPYPENLMRLAPRTALGKRFAPLLHEVTDLIVGRAAEPAAVWDRLDRGFAILELEDQNDPAHQYGQACAEAMLAAGVEPRWVEADYNNIGELLRGDLGPLP
jgi:hypothetical protein